MGECLMGSEPSEIDTLVAEFRAGNEGALEKLFTTVRPRLQQMVSLRIGAQLQARLDPSDVLQEAYLDAEQKIERYLQRPTVSPFVWLRGVAFDRLAKLQRQHLGTQGRAVARECRLPENSSVHLAQHLAARTDTASAVLSRKEIHRQLQLAIDQLSDEDRDVILMRHFEEMTNLEVAEALGIKPTTATMRHGRALARLKKQLSKQSAFGELP